MVKQCMLIVSLAFDYVLRDKSAKTGSVMIPCDNGSGPDTNPHGGSGVTSISKSLTNMQQSKNRTDSHPRMSLKQCGRDHIRMPNYLIIAAMLRQSAKLLMTNPNPTKTKSVK